MDPKLLGLGAAALFGIYADLAFNIYSATNSSPQTTELFAGDRADTLMKWVWVGGGAVLVFGGPGRSSPPRRPADSTCGPCLAPCPWEE